MKINIYTSMNGVGLEKDYFILRDIFEGAGHTVQMADWKRRHERPSHCDVAFHLEIPRYDLIAMSGRNYILPNPEWFDRKWLTSFKKLTGVLCKTRDCERIFKPLHKNVEFIGFTSIDMKQPTGKVNQFLHVQGKSEFKGTNEILAAYIRYDLPRLFLLSKKKHSIPKNVVYGGFLASEDFNALLNACMVHLCPSYYEGFGHYIWEAMSCGSVVVTTNGEPMNEFIDDPRFLVDVDGKWAHHLGVLKRVNVDDLGRKLQAIAKMPIEELKRAGVNNREKFLTNDKQFKEKVLSLL